MDKFTVDLDQVLNDFEYSELTDQYNIRAPVEPPHAAVSPSSHITKHSINNVFHSLNEYLNTNIKASLEPLDNTIVDNEGFSNSLPKISDVKKSIDESKTDQDFYNFNQSLTQQNLQFEHADSSVNSVVNNKDTESSFVEKLEVKDVDSEVLEENHSFIESEGSCVDILTPGENKCSFIEGEKESIDILAAGENKDNQINITSNNESELIEIRQDNDDEVFNSDSTDKILVFNNAPVEVTEPNISDSDDEYEDPVNNLQKIDKKDQIISLQAELLEADNEGRGQSSSGTQEASDIILKPEIKTVVSFQDDLNLEDHEIVKLLSELEEDDDLNFEMGESQVNVMTKDDDCTENVIDVQHCSDGETSSTMEKVAEVGLEVSSKSTPEDEEATVATKPNLDTQITSADNSNLIERAPDNKIESQIPQVLNSPTSDSHDLKVDNNIIKKDNDTNSSNNNKPIEKEEKSKSKIIEEPTIDSESNITSNHEVALENNQNESIIEVKKADVESDVHHESLQRPQDLPITTDIIEANRKINLIGSPGSTPYNNIYINNEIDKQETSDLDSSTSSSASFSDASSTASTASTEDIQDKTDVANLDDIKPQIADPGQCSSMPDDNLFNSTADSITANPCERQNVTNSEVFLNDGGGMEQTYPAIERSTSAQENLTNAERSWLGKEAPLWIPDSEAMSCLHCDMKFTVLKRRHHCRACGLVLCSKCCHLRFRLEYLDAEARVCNKCHDILNKESSSSGSSGSDLSPEMGNSPNNHRPNPNNPAEYCSTISPLQQAGHQATVPAVMVPVGVLKRKGSNTSKTNKSVMFCDGIRPGSDLTHLDNDFNYNNTVTKKLEKNNISAVKLNRNLPIIDSETNTFIPKNENSLPPTVLVNKSDVKYAECSNNINTVNTLKIQQLSFAIHISLYVHVRIVDMSCCMKKYAWCFSTEGLINVGQDEIVYLLEYIEDECVVPKDIFYHINNIYNDAVKGNAIKELGLSLHNSPNFLDSKNHAGFVYVRPSFQCLENVVKPKDPYLVGILIHRWETPWAKLFPLRLVLRLGAEYRYYPCPIISTRNRDSVYVEIGHTIINILADFRNFSYTLPQIRGLIIHMEDKNTTVSIPVNRYDQVIKSLNSSSDHILAFAGNFSVQADSHLVCIQDTQGNENCYSTQAINIQNKPRKITGASFIVFNGALKSSSGLTAKSNIIEDGLMIQVLPEHLEQIRDSLRAMKNHTIQCGCIDNVSDETVQITWSENDTNFNIGIVSTIDNMSLSGIPSIRVHNGKNYICHNGSRIIRWTEVFIIQNGEENPKNQDPVDISRVSENIAKATCDALVKYIDLLIANSFQKIGIRTVLQVDNVSYCAGSNGTKLPPIYMKSLDNELIPVLHRITSNNLGENAIILELIFRILNV